MRVRPTCLFLIVLFFLSWLSWGNAGAASFLEEAKRAIDEGRLEKAVRILGERLQKHSRDKGALKLRALAQTALGGFEAAERDYEIVLEEDPRDAQTHRDLGMLLAFKAKNPRHALIHLDRYLSLATDEVDAAIVAKTGQVMRSLEGKGLKKLDRVAEDLIAMAERFEAEGKPTSAIRVYERVLELQPTCASCHESLGKLLKTGDRREEGERHLAKARLFRHDG